MPAGDLARLAFEPAMDEGEAPPLEEGGEDLGLEAAAADVQDAMRADASPGAFARALADFVRLVRDSEE